MKTIKITFWTSTLIIAIMMTFSAYSYITNPALKQAFEHLGYPGYFRIELAIAKLAGVLALVLPIPSRIKEWAYAGFTITFISAFVSHLVAGDPIQFRIMPLLFLVPLAISYLTFQKIKAANRLTVA